MTRAFSRLCYFWSFILSMSLQKFKRKGNTMLVIEFSIYIVVAVFVAFLFMHFLP